MTINFHAEDNRHTYASRQAHPDWANAIRAIVNPAGKHVADIGCGGGIYSAAWADLGAATVTGVDFSEKMIQTAIEKNQGRPGLSFRQGDAAATPLPAGGAGIVFARALIHHLSDYGACFAEARRLLRPGGDYIIQDRTPDDVRIGGSSDHIRGYFFECFPRLLETELGRRPTQDAVRAAMLQAGFSAPETMTVWETRRHYENFDALAQDLRGRVGRSILHELSDAEIKQLVDFIARKMKPGVPITERDRWTIWHAKRDLK